MKKILLLLITILLLGGCNNDKEQLENAGYYQYLNDSNPTVEFTLTDNSKIKFELFKDIAPNTVKSFLSLASTGYFNGTQFLYKNENEIYAGQIDKDLPDYTLIGEFTANGYENPLNISRGTLVLSHGKNNYYNGINQFFIPFTDELVELSEKYAVFGGITEGFDALTTLENLEMTVNDEIANDFKITSIEIDAKGLDYSTFKKIEDFEFKVPETFLNDANPRVKIIFKDYGTMELELFPEVAPVSVENFLTLVDDNFYDGLTMHRIIKDFMIQGGRSTGDAVDSIVGEFSNNGVNNNLTHFRGVISMARTTPNSASSQFFICHKDKFHLDKNYAAFGYLISGFDVLDAIATVPTGANDKPITDVFIEKIERIDK